MPASMSEMSLPVLVKMLKNARSWLDKAEAFAKAKNCDVAVLLQDRLAPDMFTFTRQILIATDHAKGCAARLAGVDVPKFEDTEKTVEELKARIDKTIAFVNSVSAAAVDASADKEIVLPSPRGERRFNGLDYVRHYALPNFYFHLTTAYAILRHNGVDVGKGDFLAGGG